VNAAPRLKFTFDDYLVVDEASQARHEYLDGVILGMAGGTPEHARIAATIVAELGRQLSGKRCAVFSEALRVRSKATGFAGYPDVTVVCGALERDVDSPNTVINPTAVVEVQSPSTAEYDAGEKLRHYQQIVGLSHVVLVAHDAVRVEVWSRAGDGWAVHSYGAGERAALDAISCALDVDAVYRDPLS
jgi:Uma2 family endonuclease